MFDPLAPTLRARLSDGPAVGAAWFTIGDPTLIEIAVRRGPPDAVVVDMQHGLFDRLSLEAAMGALPPGVLGLARTRDGAAASIGEALDAGAEGVLVPLVESAAQARAVAGACRYPSTGERSGHRSGGGIRPLGDFGTHAAHANEGVVAGVMIETVAGVEAAGAIAASSVDLVFIGTGDLALSLGTTPGSEAHEAACLAVLDACREAGVPCGCFAMDAAGARRRADQGFALSVAAIDLTLFEDAMGAAMAAWRGD